MRNILLTLLFFFGPVVLIFALRYIGLLLRFWLLWRRQQKQAAQVIDVTPQPPGSPSTVFILFALSVGVLIAGLVWHRLTDTGDRESSYVPAHVDQQGRLVPASLSINERESLLPSRNSGIRQMEAVTFQRPGSCQNPHRPSSFFL